MENIYNSIQLDKTKNLVFTAMLFAIALVLSIVESALPPLPLAVPGVKFGLSNIAVMYAIFFVGVKQSYLIATLKALFVFITRGIIASILSLSGGLLSITVMILLIYLFKKKASYVTVSLAGGVFHNIGQYIAISIILTGVNLIAYLPILLLSGVGAGLITALVLKAIMPAVKKLI